MGNEEIPETATAAKGETEAEIVEIPQEEHDLRPTDIPEGIEIPEDPDSIQLIPPKQQEIIEKKGSKKTKESGQYITEEIHSIWPVIFTIVAVTFLLTSLLGGIILTSGLIPNFQEIPETNQTNKPRGQLTQILPDYGLKELTEGKQPSRQTATNRIASAKKSIVWVSNFPNDPFILKALLDVKKEKNLVVVVVTGKNSRKEDSQKARDIGLIVTQSQTDLEDPNSTLFIDSNLILDISRSRTLWESREPEVVKKTKDWIENYLIKNSKPN